MSKEYTEILRKFATLEASISESLERRNFSPEKIANRALSLALHKSDDVPKPLLAEEQESFEEAKSIDRIFILLRKYKLISYFDYGILKHITEVDGTVDDKQKLKQYEKDFVEFCQRNVREVPPIVSECNSSTRKIFRVLIEANMRTSLSDIAAAERKIAGILGLHHSVVALHEITIKSLMLTLSIPTWIAEKLFPLPHNITQYDPRCPSHLTVFRKVKSKSICSSVYNCSVMHETSPS